MNFLNICCVTINNKTIQEPFMFNKLRYTSSSFFAVIITLITFVGMSLLIAPAKYNKTTEVEFTDFSSIEEIITPDVTKQPDKKQPPKQEVVKQPPAAPKLPIPETLSRTEVDIPQGVIKTEITEITNNMKPSLHLGASDFGSNQELISLLSAPAMYPPRELINKTEGWVEVQFTVNELGNVINERVLNSQPVRVFDNAALKAIKKSKFKPVLIDGIAQSQTATQIYEFKIEKD
jgi:protein TonB